MKRWKKERESIECMAKIVEDLADISITGPIDHFIYFSPVMSGHGPRVKFYGGTSQTESTRKAPSFPFGLDGAGDAPILKDWMNKKNCPNAFDQDYLDNVKRFINAQLPLLLLTWFNHIDETYVQKYFEGGFSFENLISRMKFKSDVPEVFECKSLEELDGVCRSSNLYRFGS